MAGLDPAIHVLWFKRKKDVDAPGHLARRRASRFCPGMTVERAEDTRQPPQPSLSASICLPINAMAR